MRTRVQEKSAPCLERNGARVCALLTQVCFLVIFRESERNPTRQPRCAQAHGWPIYFQVVSRGTLRRESAAENLPEGQWRRCSRGFHKSTALANGRPFRPRPPPRPRARDSVKQVFMRSWDHRRSFGAQGASPPRIRHFVGMSSWGPDRKERER